MIQHNHRVLLTGAAGYVGTRLLRALEQRDYPVRTLLPASFVPRTSVSNPPELSTVDFCDPESLRAGMQGAKAAYYLVHRSIPNGPFEDNDCRTARAFATAAREAGLQRIIYLSGLSRRGKYSGHVCGPDDIGNALRSSGVPVIEFRSSLIVGAGSLAFEIIRELAEKMEVICLPGWTRRRTYPIAIDDLISYLVAGLEAPFQGNATFELVGADHSCFADLLQEYVRQRGLKRMLIPLPLLMPRLSILSLSLIAPSFARFAQELVASLCVEDPLDGSRAQEVFAVRPKGIRETIQSAFAAEHSSAETRRSDDVRRGAPSSDAREPKFGLRIVDSRWVHVSQAPSAAFRPIERIGGKTGWYYANWLWHLRGALDFLVGGAGMRNGRKDPQVLAVGDPVDFWRVEAIEKDRLLRLIAEMKLPGRAWLQFEIGENGSGSRIRQTAIFDPVGLVGLLYWYTLYPAHELIFPGLLKGIAQAISRESLGQREDV